MTLLIEVLVLIQLTCNFFTLNVQCIGIVPWWNTPTEWKSRAHNENIYLMLLPICTFPKMVEILSRGRDVFKYACGNLMTAHAWNWREILIGQSWPGTVKNLDFKTEHAECSSSLSIQNKSSKHIWRPECSCSSKINNSLAVGPAMHLTTRRFTPNFNIQYKVIPLSLSLYSSISNKVRVKVSIIIFSC